MASQADNPYNSCTRRYFGQPVHAGDLKGEYTVSAVALADESTAGARIQLAVGVEDGRLKECRFRVFGCPHLIAAGEWLCEHYEGKTLDELQQFKAADCMNLLAVPVEKTGRILLLEDAIRSLTGILNQGAR